VGKLADYNRNQKRAKTSVVVCMISTLLFIALTAKSMTSQWPDFLTTLFGIALVLSFVLAIYFSLSIAEMEKYDSPRC
jgi:uncharacterized membrane protein